MILKKNVPINSICSAPGCRMITTILVDEDGYLKWRRRDTIHDALPQLEDEEKRVLTTNICKGCWDKKALEN